MGFGVDYSKTNNFVLIAKGEYEVIIKDAYEDVSKSGKPFINVSLIIRNDVDQPHQDSNLTHALRMKNDPTPEDLACDGYSEKQIQSLSKAAQLENGKTYASIAQWCGDLPGKLIRVTVEHEMYNDKPYARVKWTNESQHPVCGHTFKNQPAQVSSYAPAQLSDEELPF